eukprot:TRINITY_DN25239_c0_g1_i1.p1 TRINITY_DN25239_c0_g1~~TRINITY_DN25239_c0_g1_i1.p1  ORF type:complete len:255 (+),score=45.48 TRINITY_DN25239_c0_g1_i1:103-867(+)
MCIRDRFGGKRNGLRASFVNREKTHYESRIKDLEKTLAINKGIITELLSTTQDKEYEKYKGIFEKMITESKLYNDQLKNALKQRDDYHAKLLISEQIADNQTRKNEETVIELESKIKDLLEQLNQKEFTLQHIEHCYKKAISMLSKFVNKDCEVFALLQELNSGFFNFKTLKISDVIEENRSLKLKLKENEDKVLRLEKKKKKKKSTRHQKQQNKKIIHRRQNTMQQTTQQQQTIQQNIYTTINKPLPNTNRRK